MRNTIEAHRARAVSIIAERRKTEPDTLKARLRDRIELGHARAADSPQVYEARAAAAMFRFPLSSAIVGGYYAASFIAGFLESSKHGVVRPLFSGYGATQA